MTSSSIFKTSQAVALWSSMELFSCGCGFHLFPTLSGKVRFTWVIPNTLLLKVPDLTFCSSESLCRVNHKLWRHHTSAVGSVLVSSLLSPVCLSHDSLPLMDLVKLIIFRFMRLFFPLLRVGLPTSFRSCGKEADISSCPFIRVSPLTAVRQKLKAGR